MEIKKTLNSNEQCSLGPHYTPCRSQLTHSHTQPTYLTENNCENHYQTQSLEKPVTVSPSSTSTCCYNNERNQMEADIFPQIMVGYQPDGNAAMRERAVEASEVDRRFDFTPSRPPSASPANCAWRSSGQWS